LSRDDIIRSLIEVLVQGYPYFVLRCDIKSFYESIDTSPIRMSIAKHGSIIGAAKLYLDRFFATYCPTGFGLPRGIGLSANLAELSFREFDRNVCALDFVFRYFRFSDDILIVGRSTSRVLSVQAKLEVEALLPQGFKLNRSKSYCVPEDPQAAPSEFCFEYLGYQFKVHPPKRGKLRTVEVGIAPKKIKRIKSRLILSAINFQRDQNFSLLKLRLRYLAGNYRTLRAKAIYVKTSRHVKSGIYYNYSCCGQYDGLERKAPKLTELKSLDQYYKNFLNGKCGKHSEAMRRILTQDQRAELLRISFHAGYRSKFQLRLKSGELGEIRRAWRYAER